MRLNSLALRLFFSATAWTVLILVIVGFVLSSIYRSAVERAFDRRLGVYLRAIVSDVATPELNAENFPQSLGEPLFDLPLSGWYWQVTRLDPPSPRCVRRARCGTTRCRISPIPAFRASAGELRAGYAEGPEGQPLRMVERTIDLGEEGRYLVAVGGDAGEIDEETQQLRRRAARHLRHHGRRAAADHDLPGALRPGAAQAHLRGRSRRSAPARPNGWRATFRSRSRRSRARPTR